MSWAKDHIDAIRRANLALKDAVVFEDDIEDKVDDFLDAIERLERILDYLETREN